MKALVVPEAGRLEVRQIPAPEPGPYDALVRIEACGICNSTDLKLMAGTMFWAPPCPFVLGHEAVGTVLKLGGKVRKFRLGDRVTRPAAFWPGSRAGLNSASGGMAEFGVVRDGEAIKADGDSTPADDYLTARQNAVPRDLDPEHAVLAIALSETASVLKHLPDLRGRKVVVAGTGVAGLSFALWAKMAGGFVVVLGRRPDRLARADQVGADAAVDTTAGDWLERARKACGGGADGAIEATGDAELAGLVLELLKPDAFAASYGVPPAGIKYPRRWKDATVEEHLSYPWVADLLKRGFVRPEWFLTHRWPFGAAAEAFAQVGRGEVVKGVLTMGPGQ